METFKSLADKLSASLVEALGCESGTVEASLIKAACEAGLKSGVEWAAHEAENLLHDLIDGPKIDGVVRAIRQMPRAR